MAHTLLVVPCFNEEERLVPERFLEFARGWPQGGLLFVDDGSTDRTPAILAELCAALPGKLQTLRLEQNSGKAEAVRRGIHLALEQGCERVGFWDADLATPLEAVAEFEALLDERPDTELVMGARVALLGRDIQRRPLRHFLGRVLATAISLTLRMKTYDTQCGAKLLRVTPDVRAVFERPFLSRWLFDVEILARLAARKGAVPASAFVQELPLREWRDVSESKVSPLDFFRAFVDLVRIRNERHG